MHMTDRPKESTEPNIRIMYVTMYAMELRADFGI